MHSPRSPDDAETPSSQNKKPLVPKVPKEWTPPVEAQFQSWADAAACYVWMHDRASRRFRRVSYYYNIPIIVFSTLTGTANFGISGIAPEGVDQKYIQAGIGVVSIAIGVLGTLNTYFRYAEKTEAHSSALQGWSKFHRSVCQELAIERTVRMPANDFYKLCKAEYDRLMETSPALPMNIIDRFRKDVIVVPEVVIPQEILDRIDHAQVHLTRTPVNTNDTESYAESVVNEVLRSNPRKSATIDVPEE
jgi:hypothetical protein